MTPSDEDDIIARLKADAKGGSVTAAKELREWLRARAEREQQVQSLDAATSYGQLSAVQREELRARLITEALAAWPEPEKGVVGARKRL